MSADVYIPSNYTITLQDNGRLDTGVLVDIVKIPLVTTKIDPGGQLNTSSSIAIKEVPTITMRLDPSGELRTDSKMAITMGDINLRLKEIPSVRVHMPAKFDFGISVLGMELMSFSLCGEAMVITEPYQPNKYEICEPAHTPAG